ncbi:DNA-deoxyinosine glycosylase [Bacillus sp. JJ1521]|uniref:DNA-deoxyinosine glycosylase n=1 Tax=Bacillus sp. JJ1521 TaxID=3122957 RepID=UPI002FFDD9D6
MERIFGLEPVAGEDTRVLILGSMPSVESLNKQEYYGNKRNHFWKIMFMLFNSHELTNYEDKISFLKEKNIALWDVLYSCHREGSLDSNIKNEEPNEIEAFVKNHPSLRLIVCNGTKSYQSYKKFIGFNRLPGVEIIKLPSTSPVPGKYNKTLEGKLQEWKIIEEYLSRINGQ